MALDIFLADFLLALDRTVSPTGIENGTEYILDIYWYFCT